MKSEKFENGKRAQFNFNKISFRVFGLKSILLFTFSFLLFTFSAFAQTADAPPYEAPQPDDAVPPPLRLISKQDKSSLDAQTDIGERTKLSLDLMEAHLKRAEDLYAQDSLDRMFDELGDFGALIDNTLAFLKKNVIGRGKVLNNYKKLEISLRKFSPRIELIRRELPLRYEYWVRSLIKDVRAARTKAVEPLFGDSVVPSEKEN